jgi:hypothetical protein
MESRIDKNTRSGYDFDGSANDLSYGFKRAKMSWYTIDPIFYAQNQTEFQMMTFVERYSKNL